jgi:hypothetical protein
MNRVTVLMEGTTESSLASPCHVRTQREVSSAQPRRVGLSPDLAMLAP